MKRRKFVATIGVNTVGISFCNSALFAGNEISRPKVQDLQNHLRSLHPIEGNSVDQIIIGDPEARITKVGTCWMPYWDTLRKAKEAGVNTLVVHEPTFYTHLDLQHIEDDFKRFPEKAKRKYLDQVEKKKKWIEENKISIIRCHDVLDIIPEFGIPFAFGQALGFSDKDIIRSETYYNVYRIKAAPAKEIARQFASRLIEFGQEGIALYGDPDRVIKSVGLGTGAICDPIRFMDLEADLRIAIDDSVKTWTQTYFAQDTGDPLIIVNHGTTEEKGMMLLNAHLKKVFKGIDVFHFKQGCGYKWIT